MLNPVIINILIRRVKEGGLDIEDIKREDYKEEVEKELTNN